ncbi:MAG TPA: TonB-dependent receptor [Vicinamibacterales bacterium]|nr:TonB-dependent receptor [Vicinamibacterales bacterium]
MKALARSFVLAFVVVVPTAAPAAAQGPTSGSINGVVTDNSSAVLPGVSVVATSPALIGQQESTTNEKGQYRFPLLPPGDYKLVYQLSGFTKVIREGIHVGVGFAAEVNVQLQLATLQESVTVTGQSPVIDTQNTNVQNNFTAQMMQAIPNARDIWSLIAEAPGMTVTRFDVGGSTAGTQTGYSAYGFSGQNRVQIDGVNTTEGTGSAGFYFDYGAFDEVQLGADSNDASMPTPGVLVNTVIKSGGNTVKGDIYFDYENKAFQGTNIDDRQLRLGAGTGTRILRYRDPNGSIGGPIKRDKLWYFVSLRDQDIVTSITGFPVDKPDPNFGSETRLTNGTYKFTYQLNQANKLSTYLQYGRKQQPQRGAGATAYRDAISVQDSGSWAGNVEWSDIMSPRFFMVLRGSTFGYNFPLVADPLGKDNVRRVENSTGNVAGGSASNRTDRRRYMGEWTSTYFKDGFLGGDHSFKFGWVSEWEVTEDQEFGPKGFYQLTFNSPTGAPDFTTPSRVTIYNRPSISYDQVWHHGGYINDQIRVRKGLTINAGVRMDRYNTGYPDETIFEGPWTAFFYQGQALPNGFAFAPTPWADLHVQKQWGFVKYPHAFAPRFGIAWDVARNGRTVVKANWGRYFANPGTTTSNINPVSGTTAVFDWIDRNGDRLFTPDEFGTFRSGAAPGTAATNFAKDIGHPYSDDTSFSVERELRDTLALRSAYVYRRSANNYVNLELARTGDLYTETRTATDPGPDGLIGTSDDGGAITYTDIPAASLVPSQVLRTTSKDQRSTASNIDFTLTKRMSRRWSLVANYLFTWSADYSLVQNPNQAINNPQKYTNWTFKLFGSYEAPYGIVVSPVLRHQSGLPIARIVNVPQRAASNGLFAYAVDPTGDWRQDNVTIVDTRVEKRFHFGARREFGVFFDAFNIANSNAAQNQDNIVGRRSVTLPSGETVQYQRFLRPTTIIGPRIFRLGVKVGF